MRVRHQLLTLILIFSLAVGLMIAFSFVNQEAPAAVAADGGSTEKALVDVEDLIASVVQERDMVAGDYVLLTWNDLGMHCYNRDFSTLAILPPANTLWAQLVLVADPPQIITTGVTLTYVLTDNTYSVGKSNFWDYDEQLYGVDLPPNVGLMGKGMAGTLDLSMEHPDHFVAEAIPLTEFRDSDYEANPSNPVPYPYQLATVTAWDSTTNEKLAETIVVAPVSTEMHCEVCHDDNGQGNPNIASGSVELNIIRLHDQESQDEYPPGHEGPLEGRLPIRCSECHPSNALPLPSVETLPSLSQAMHGEHSDVISDTREGCYLCHPGPQTQCQRGVMSHQYDLTCPDCHDGLAALAADGREPWLDEPRCDSADCHPSYAYDDALLYRQAQGHGEIYCEACHDSPHAIAPSREPNDQIKFIAWQGYAGSLRDCTVCHATRPAEAGPHDVMALVPAIYLPLLMH